MTTLRQAAQAALDALDDSIPTGVITLEKFYSAKEALRAALAEPQPKPIGVDGLPKNILAKPQDYASTQPEPVASTNARTQFEHFFAESRKGKGPSRRPTFAQLQDGTYVEDSIQRHWWTWQNAAPQAQQPLREGEVMGAYMDFDRTSDHAWSNAEYLTRFGLYISKRTVERAHKIGAKP